MFDAALDLRWTACIIGAVPGSFALITDQRRATLGASAYELYGLCYDGALVYIDAYDFGYDFAAFLDIDTVADVEVERAYDVRRTVVPASCTGVILATGVTAPVRPT